MMKKSSRIAILSATLLIFLCSLFIVPAAQAQCPMCKHNVESSLSDKSSKKVGLGINHGIIVLLVMPYILFGAIGVLWYRNSRYQKLKRLAFDEELA